MIDNRGKYMLIILFQWNLKITLCFGAVMVDAEKACRQLYLNFKHVDFRDNIPYLVITCIIEDNLRKNTSNCPIFSKIMTLYQNATKVEAYKIDQFLFTKKNIIKHRPSLSTKDDIDDI